MIKIRWNGHGLRLQRSKRSSSKWLEAEISREAVIMCRFDYSQTSSLLSIMQSRTIEGTHRFSVTHMHVNIQPAKEAEAKRGS